VDVVYHIPLAHRNSLPSEGVVLRDLYDDGGGLGPGAGVADIIGSSHAEGVAVPQLAGVHRFGGRGGSEPGGPVAIVNLHLHVVGGNAGALVAAAPSHGDGGRAAARGDGDGGKRCVGLPPFTNCEIHASQFSLPSDYDRTVVARFKAFVLLNATQKRPVTKILTMS